MVVLLQKVAVQRPEIGLNLMAQPGEVVSQQAVDQVRQHLKRVARKGSNRVSSIK